MNKHFYFLLIISLLTIDSISAQNASWTAVLPAKFPTNVSGQINGISRVSQLKFHPSNPAKMYAESARGGLFLSTDTGHNWTVAAGTDFMAYARLASVCIDHTNDQIIYLGTGDHDYYYTGNGVMKSTDGGATFSQTGLNSSRLVVEMLMDPTNHLVVVAATNAGIYKTTDGGTTWVLKSTSRTFDDLKQRSPASRVLYATTTDSAFFRSFDFGDTWTQVTTGITLPSGVTTGAGCRVAVTPADTNVVYLGMIGNGGMLYKSTDGGTSFTAMKTAASPYLSYYANSSTSSGQGDYNFGLGVDRVNPNRVYFVAHNVWRSDNSGTSWIQLTNWYAICHTDMHQVFTSPYDNSKLYDMNDGGVWLSTDSGTNWTPRSDGIAGYEIYRGNCSPTRRDMISIGTQDNGELYSTSAGWYTNRGGDWGSPCYFDYRANSSMVYYMQNNKRRLVTGSDATYGLPAQVTAIQDMAFNRSNTDLCFVADSFIYRTANLTAATPTWTQIASLGKKVMAIHSSFADANNLYIITADGTIYVSTNALSATPTFTSHALPNATSSAASITSIKTNSNVLYITCNTKAYRSSDNGTTWTNITYNLPSTNHVRVLADEYYSASELVFLATNNTVYYKVANANTWTIYNGNLPTRTNVVDLSIYNDSTANTLLRVTTYGRGMWETPINNVRSLTVGFTVDNNYPCVGGTVNFNDLSTGNITSRSWSLPGGTPATSTSASPAVTYSSSGTYTVILTVSDGTNTLSDTQVNYISTKGANLPLMEGFETANNPPTGWKNIDNGTVGDAWAKVATGGGYGTSTNAMMYDNYSWNVVGQKDDLQTMRLDLTSYASVKLTFDVAYQVFTGYSDSLAVLISTDCGSTFSRVYGKGGASLSTAGSGSSNFVPSSVQWRTDTVDLSAYIGQTVILDFQNINGYGNKLYLDNVNVKATVAVNAGRDTVICGGSTVVLGAAATSGLNYTWTPATGLSSASVGNPTATPSATTQYIVTARHAISGVSNSDTVIVTVRSGAANASLASTSSSGVSLSEECTVSGWTYYADPADHSRWLFGIYKNGNTFTANVSIGVKSYSFDSNENTTLHKSVYVMSRYWNVTLASGSVSSPVSVRFFYDSNDVIAMRNLSTLRASAFGGNVSSHPIEWFKTSGVAYSPNMVGYSDITGRLSPDPTTVTGRLNGVAYVEYQGLTSFSGGTGGIRVSPVGYGLPVRMLYLTAEPIDNKYIRLDWATASELDNKGFEIQRSTDGQHFELIGWTDGHGTTSSTLQYMFKDISASEGMVYYYRLRQVDVDGHYEYSDIVSASLYGSAGLVIEELRPNPAIHEAYINAISTAEQTVTVTMTDILGQTVYTSDWKLSSGLNGTTLHLEGIPVGTYLVSLKTMGKAISKRLVVVR